MHKLGDLLYHPEAGLGWIEDIKQTRWSDSPLYTVKWCHFEPKTARNYTYYKFDDIEYYRKALSHVLNGGTLEDW